jgi:hypothetical protein
VGWFSRGDAPGVGAYILRNLKDPDEIIAFGLIEGELDQIWY